MSSSLSYTTPKRNRPVIEVDFELDGQTYTARKPKNSVLVYMEASRSRAASTADKLHAAMTFLDACLTPATQQAIQYRLRDPDDELELVDLFPIMGDLSEEFERLSGGSQDASSADVIDLDGARTETIPAAADPAGPNRTARRRATPKKAAAPKKAVAAKKAPGRALPR